MDERIASLKTSAQCKGIINYAYYRRYDTNWVVREAMLLKAVESDAYLQVSQASMLMNFTSMLYTTSNLQSKAQFENAKSSYEKSYGTYKHLRNQILPWVEKEIAAEEKKVINKAEDDWKEFERLQNTEKFKKTMENTVKMFKDMDDARNADIRLFKKIEELKEAGKKKTKKIIKAR